MKKILVLVFFLACQKAVCMEEDDNQSISSSPLALVKHVHQTSSAEEPTFNELLTTYYKNKKKYYSSQKDSTKDSENNNFKDLILIGLQALRHSDCIQSERESLLQELRTIYKTITIPDRPTFKDKFYGLADELSDSEDTRPGIDKVYNKKLRKLANKNTIVELEKKQSAQKTDLLSLEENILGIEKELKAYQETINEKLRDLRSKQSVLLDKQQERSTELMLIQWANQELTEDQQQEIHIIKTKIKALKSELKDIQEAIKLQGKQLEEEDNGKERTEILAAKKENEKKATKLESEIKPLVECKKLMQQRSKAEEYSWFDLGRYLMGTK